MQYKYIDLRGNEYINEEIDDRILKHLNRSHLRYLYHDDIGDLILISKSGAFFLYDDQTISCQFVSKSHFNKARKLGLTKLEWGTDDGLYTFRSSIDNLDRILKIGEFKRRPDMQSKWTENMIRKLSLTNIEPFRRPQLLEEKEYIFKVKIKDQDAPEVRIRAKTHGQARYIYKKEIAKVDSFSDIGNLSVRKVNDHPNIIEDDFIPINEEICLNASSI